MAVIETTTFRLADGVDEAAFLQADEQVRTGFLYQQPGIMRATTAKSAAGEWILVVVWASEEVAARAAEAEQKDAAVERFMQLVLRPERKRYRDLD